MPSLATAHLYCKNVLGKVLSCVGGIPVRYEAVWRERDLLDKSKKPDLLLI